MRGKKRRNNSEWDDWKRWKKGWPYKGDAPNDPQYLKERSEFFRSNAPEDAPYNGWWRNHGIMGRSESGK